MGANTYWADSRLNAQRPIARGSSNGGAVALPMPGFNDYPRDLTIGGGTRDAKKTRRRQPLVSSWGIFAMIIIATFAICLTVTKRTQATRSAAAQKYESLNTDVETLRRTNFVLARDIERLKNNPRAIETAARERLNMVRASEIVIPIQ